MSEYTIARFIMFLLLSIIFAFNIRSQIGRENGEANEPSTQQKYRSFFYSMQLPLCLILVLFLEWAFHGLEYAFHALLTSCFAVFLHIGVYYVCLLVMLPILRKHISARASAFLWLVPNYLYVFLIYDETAMEPVFFLHIPGKLIWFLLGIWLIGFVAVMGSKILSHISYRKYIMQGAKLITDPEILALWEKEIEIAHIPDVPRELWKSANVSTPMTVGLFKYKMDVLLPMKEYSMEELELVFRHELVHIGREDQWNKFFMTFCTAMCWFNPFVWHAMKKCAEDLELSCDETVLIYADEAKRHRYAELILKTAGDERGFNTCLSVKAEALQYRLRNILNAKKRFTGAICVGVTFFLLAMTCGYVGITYGDTSGKELIFKDIDTSQLEYAEYNEIACEDEEALMEYLETMKIRRITKYDRSGDKDRYCSFLLSSPDKNMSFHFTDKMLDLIVLDKRVNGDIEDYTYYLPDGVDWEILESYFVK